MRWTSSSDGVERAAAQSRTISSSCSDWDAARATAITKRRRSREPIGGPDAPANDPAGSRASLRSKGAERSNEWRRWRCEAAWLQLVRRSGTLTEAQSRAVRGPSGRQ